MELTAGTLITPQIRLERMLGEGGMGSVWVAEHLGLGIRVAVKFISEELASQPEVRERFTREARASARIKSPHVVQVFDTGMLEERVPYIVMELLEGHDLRDRIRQLKRLPINEVVTVVRQACKALSKAHATGVIHRDIKPDNLFICDPEGDAHIKILDFGVAKSDDTDLAMTSTGAVVGTPYYMSPEQLMSAKHVDVRADLWSLGVVAYHALTGQRPFEAETFPGLVLAIERGVYPAPYGRLGVGSAELDAWIDKALNRDIDQRFTSAQEMATALEEAAGVPRAQQPSFVDLSSSADNEPPSAISYADTEIDAKSQTHSTMAQSVTDSRALAPPKSRRGGVFAALGVLSVAGVLAAWFALGGRGVSAEPVHSGAASVSEPDAPAPTLEAKSAPLPSGSASDDSQAATPPDEAPPPQPEETAEVPTQTTKSGATTKPTKATAAKQTAPQAPSKQAPSKASAKPSSGSTAKAPVSNPTPDYGF
ncbi:MAG: protein kinase [Polyangiaceae bacterium]|nr:protein kinase [Polyangiaceae bacterium]